MSVTWREIEIETRAWTRFTPEFILSRVSASSALNQRCPRCHSIIYSRRHELCGVCAQPLPRKLLFDDYQARNIAALLKEERERHRTWLRKREAGFLPHWDA